MVEFLLVGVAGLIIGIIATKITAKNPPKALEPEIERTKKVQESQNEDISALEEPQDEEHTCLKLEATSVSALLGAIASMQPRKTIDPPTADRENSIKIDIARSDVQELAKNLGLATSTTFEIAITAASGKVAAGVLAGLLGTPATVIMALVIGHATKKAYASHLMQDQLTKIKEALDKLHKQIDENVRADAKARYAQAENLFEQLQRNIEYEIVEMAQNNAGELERELAELESRLKDARAQAMTNLEEAKEFDDCRESAWKAQYYQKTLQEVSHLRLVAIHAVLDLKLIAKKTAQIGTLELQSESLQNKKGDLMQDIAAVQDDLVNLTMRSATKIMHDRLFAMNKADAAKLIGSLPIQFGLNVNTHTDQESERKIGSLFIKIDETTLEIIGASSNKRKRALRTPNKS